MKKIILSSIIVILLLFFVVIFFVIKKDSQDVSNINTNNDLAQVSPEELTEIYDGELFSFKYPKSLNILEDDDFVWIFMKKENKDTLGKILRISKSFEYNIENLPIDEWWLNNGPQNESKAPYPEDEESYKFKI